jgi:plasmid stability protein
MSHMIQIRNVPTRLHRALKARAAMEGKSMSELLLEQIDSWLALPSEQELRVRLANAEPFGMTESSAELIRRERDAA